MKDGTLAGEAGAPFDVQDGGGQDGFRAKLVSRRTFAAGTLVAAIGPHRVVDQPSYRSVQVGRHSHIEDIGVLVYLNHSCAPTVFVDVERLEVRALVDIDVGRELTFFYPSTEWDMAQPFHCWCGAESCLGWVAGARVVAPRRLALHALAPHIVDLAGLRRRTATR